MATVHLARLKGAGQFSKTVAIKRMDERIAQDRDFVGMFLDEATLVARVRHPNVVSTLDLIQEGDELLIVMEYVEGVTLKHLMRIADDAGERIPPEISVSLVAGALRGLHAAHVATADDGTPLGIVHRDVSPDNIIVGRDGYPRVIDFGVAKALDRSSTTNEGELKGKIAYMAPEQVAGDEITHRADVFMASIVLWELLTGRRLFKGKSAPEVIYRLVSHDTPLASELDPTLPSGLVDVVARGLSRNPADRWPTALEMADALEAACPRVSPTEVSSWVNRLAAARLEELRALRSEMESAPRSSESAIDSKEVTQVALTTDARESTTARNLMIVIGLIVVVSGFGVYIAFDGGDAAPAAPSTPSGTPPAESAALPSESVAATVSPAPVASSADTVHVAPSASSAKPVARPPQRPVVYPRPSPKPKPKLYGIE